MQIANAKIGKNHPTFIVAELSCNHQQKFEIAVETIKAAKRAGADAIKLQTYTPDTITLDSDKECFQIRSGTLWDGKTLHELYREAYTPWEWQPKLKEIAESEGLICFSSPFDPTAVDFLEEMKVPAYKIASFEIVDLPLISYAASKGKPMILSTGIATLEEIEKAVKACHDVENNQIALLKCTSAYPAPFEEMNLNTLPDLMRRFSVIGGISDHSLGIAAPVAAVTLGASIIEKHFILDKALGGPDVAFSLDPAEFQAMVEAVRSAEKALGHVTYELSEKVKQSRFFARSLFAVKDIAEGEVLTEENVRSIRPNVGLPPERLPHILGKVAREAIPRGTPLKETMFS